MLMGVFGFTDPDEEDNATRKKTTCEKHLRCGSLAVSLAVARRAAKQRFGIGGATVMYGLPMLTAAEADRLASLKLKNKEQQRINAEELSLPLRGGNQEININGGNAATEEESANNSTANTFASPSLSKGDHIVFNLIDVDEDEETTIESCLTKEEKGNDFAMRDTSPPSIPSNDNSNHGTTCSAATSNRRDVSHQPKPTHQPRPSTASAPHLLQVVQREDMRRIHQEDEDEGGGDELFEKYAVCVVAEDERSAVPSLKHPVVSKAKNREDNDGERSSTPLAPLRTTIGPASSHQEEPTKQGEPLDERPNEAQVLEAKEIKGVRTENDLFFDDDGGSSEGRPTVAYKFKGEGYSAPPPPLPQQTRAAVGTNIMTQTTSDVSAVTNTRLPPPRNLVLHEIGQKRLERSPTPITTSLGRCHGQQAEQHLPCGLQRKVVFQVDADEENVPAVLKRAPRTERAVVATESGPTVSSAVIASSSQSKVVATLNNNTTCLPPRALPSSVKDGGKASTTISRHPARCHDACGGSRARRKGILAFDNEEDEEDDFSLGALLAAGGSVGRISPPPPPLASSSRAVSRSPPPETPSRPLIYSQQDANKTPK